MQAINPNNSTFALSRLPRRAVVVVVPSRRHGQIIHTLLPAHHLLSVSASNHHRCPPPSPNLNPSSLAKHRSSFDHHRATTTANASQHRRRCNRPLHCKQISTMARTVRAQFGEFQDLLESQTKQD